MRGSEKTAVRRTLWSARRRLSDRAARQAALNKMVLRLPQLTPLPGCVALFSALPDEADPFCLGEHLRSQGAETAYPRMDGGRLRFHPARPDMLRPGPMGILQPPSDLPERALGAVDLFVVPGLGFTRSGHRLGYGRGFYDRALAEAHETRTDGPAPAVGVAFSVQVVETLPVEPHDVPLSGVVTEVGFFPAG